MAFRDSQLWWSNRNAEFECDLLRIHVRGWHLTWHLNNRTKPDCIQPICPVKDYIFIYIKIVSWWFSMWFSFFWLTHQNWVTHLSGVWLFSSSGRGRRVSREQWCTCFSSLKISVSRGTYRRKATGEKTT